MNRKVERKGKEVGEKNQGKTKICIPSKVIWHNGRGIEIYQKIKRTAAEDRRKWNSQLSTILYKMIHDDDDDLNSIHQQFDLILNQVYKNKLYI